MNSRKSLRVLELAIAFWIGVGLISIIDVWKISLGLDPILYNWIMFGVSLVFIIVCFVLLTAKKK